MKLAVLVLSVLMFAAPARAQDTATVEIEMDLELFLAVDVSRSMSPAELEIQRRGYASALVSPDVIKAIEGGMLGRIALTYVEWAGEGSQRVVVPWTPIRNAAEAQAVADQISSFYVSSLRRTSISDALSYAAGAFDDNGYLGLRRVIDISGDGPNNMGPPVLEARAAALARGIIINGLPLMTQDALSNIWGIPDLDVYYTRCVIGGPGAFVIPVKGWVQFEDAVRRKLVQEIASVPTRPERMIRAQADAPYDCLVGERMWRQNRSYFDIP
jgi:hypothetical protein